MPSPALFLFHDTWRWKISERRKKKRRICAQNPGEYNICAGFGQIYSEVVELADE